MRRFVYVLAAALAVSFVVAPAASAIGPGGWDHVGVGATSTTPSLNGTVVSALNTQNPGQLYVGGNFTSAGGNHLARRIARWDGTTWHALGTTPITNGSVSAIAYDAATGRVFAGGQFVNAGGNPDADFLAVFDGSTWKPFCTSTGPHPSFGGSVAALQIIGNTLYVGGTFQNGADIDAADYLLACDLTTGTSSSTVSDDGDFPGGVYALTADSNGTLYAGGQFINLDGIAAADHVAAYSGGAWHAMGTGLGGPTSAAVDDYVRSLTAHGTDVYVGTDSINVAGIPNADHVARWSGTAWSAVGSNDANTDGWFANGFTIDALATYGQLVVAAGSFQNANGQATADEIAYFDGTTWRPIGSDGAGNGPLSQHPNALAIFLGNVYVGGAFTVAGGDGLARFLASHSLRLPDAAIGPNASGPFQGNNVYSATGAGEVRSVTVHRGHTTTAYVRIQNDGLVPASFQVKGTGDATGITARYYQGATNVTGGVSAGTYSTANIAARGDVHLRLVVTVANSSASSATIVTTLRSQAGTPHDAVRLVVHATG